MAKLTEPTNENIEAAIEKVKSLEGKIEVLKSLMVSKDIARSER